MKNLLILKLLPSSFLEYPKPTFNLFLTIICMFDRIPVKPPIIVPLELTKNERPLLSVMVPSYNCLAYLSDTLASVLSQDWGEEQMQIEVVDDCSTDGHIAALVQEIGNGRIKYYRQEVNRGSLRNFETCINRAKGQWVHLLHGDDCVKPGFYNEIKNLFLAYNQAGAVFTNNNYIDEAGNIFSVRDELIKETGIVNGFLLKIAKWPRLEPAAIVVKRAVYEQLGSFYGVHYGEDWEMWTRIAANFPVAYSPRCLASYRVLRDNNITQKSYLTGQNVEDMVRVINIIQNYIPAANKKNVKSTALKYYSVHCAKTANILYPAQKKAAFIQAKQAWRIHKNAKAGYFLGMFYLKVLRSYIS